MNNSAKALKIKAKDYEIIFTENIRQQLTHILKNEKRKIFILTDENTSVKCFPIVERVSGIDRKNEIIIQKGEENKTLENCAFVWKKLMEKDAARNDLLIHLGGGIVCDLGGFVASTFKRGISFANIPTTLLAMVDASFGGKTGINFLNFKNQIGTFTNPEWVLIHLSFLETLDSKEFIAGFAEMLKHGLISDFDYLESLMKFDIENRDYKLLQELVYQSVEIKNLVINRDPKEKQIRKMLNFGHTIGHAFETLYLIKNQPILHGIAVAHGIICELYLSQQKAGFPEEKLEKIKSYIFKTFEKLDFSKSDFKALISYCKHDKKNKDNAINFTLLADTGMTIIDQYPDEKEIYDAFDYYLNS